jgi:hypothetical protein
MKSQAARILSVIPAFFLLTFSLYGQRPIEPVVARPALNIAVVNQSAYVNNEDLASWVAAIQLQLDQDVAPIWKTNANLSVQQNPAADAWVCTLVDGASYADGAPLGLHFVNSNGIPACTVNAGMIVLNGLGTVSMPLSHEIMEMSTDSYLSSVTFSQSTDPNSATVYLREICDPVASYGYLINGVTVSDFTYPPFWQGGFPPPGSQLDKLGIAVLTLAPTAHSYMMVRYIASFGGINSLDSWTYIWGSYCAFGPC